ncbi:dihydrolipoamide acetyltransferase component of pyruvate dehydrogenase complex [Polaribacter pacificus]|uniref:Dihydrolipoamide acetyltransferase component of pyruvate dehydrogenase complex n=1 Tax=Polaribacter pacificus TaxID=1775173 RepID=A0A917I066_9FLAO|nr:dihydrolipoamide acetyltransferase family protein [Polaribacter pacificus]GGH00876.1 dihydrolipoamide acetyltransferase component of pyruvate dehydrogenase complex [Polaribacter pacificus]
MAIVVNMPRLSDTMEEGVVAKWLKNIGDTIEEGDILAEIETDKATMEFESFNEGTLLYIGVQEGESAPVDSLLAVIGDKDEDITALLNQAETSEPQTEAEPQKETVNTSTESTQIPEGVIIITMPRLSDTMTDGTVASWLKIVGDKIEEGDILAEIETDKATMEFESFNEGTLLYIGVQEGESAPVDSLLAIIGKDGTDVSAVVAAHKAGTLSESSSSDAKTTEDKPKEAAKASETQTTQITQETTQTGGRILASPLAKKIAKDKGIQLSALAGSGENGRIIKKDVENYTPAAASTTVKQTTSSATNNAPVAAFVPAGEEHEELVKNSQMRKAIAKSLGNSKFNAPHFYLTIEVDMENSMASRKTINAIPDTKVSFNDMVVKACAMALKKHPQVNTSWTEEATVYKSQIHIGVAVAVDEGLVVPVLKFTDQMSLTQIGASVRDLAGKARNKKISPAEMQGSTFTISNLGMFGIQEFTSIINQPNSAILSVGAIVEKPVVKNGQIVVGNTMKVTLACDHRTVDGAVGAQFLQTLKTYLENPVTMLA